MGVSTDAILAFGFDLGAEEDLPESLQGVEDGLDEWLYQQEHLPYEAILHCSDSYRMFFLAAKGTQVIARRGHPSEAMMNPAPEPAIEAMRDFCREHGIQWQEPRWYIFSLWL